MTIVEKDTRGSTTRDEMSRDGRRGTPDHGVVTSLSRMTAAIPRGRGPRRASSTRPSPPASWSWPGRSRPASPCTWRTPGTRSRRGSRTGGSCRSSAGWRSGGRAVAGAGASPSADRVAPRRHRGRPGDVVGRAGVRRPRPGPGLGRVPPRRRLLVRQLGVVDRTGHRGHRRPAGAAGGQAAVPPVAARPGARRARRRARHRRLGTDALRQLVAGPAPRQRRQPGRRRLGHLPRRRDRSARRGARGRRDVPGVAGGPVAHGGAGRPPAAQVAGPRRLTASCCSSSAWSPVHS